MPNLHPINENILTHRYLTTQVQNTFQENVDQIKNFGLAPSLPPPAYGNTKGTCEDMILFIHLNPQRELQFLKVPLDF